MRALLFAALLVINAATALAQERMLQFDVASLRENKTGAPPAGDQEDSNVPLGPGNVYSPTGGQLNLRNVSLVQMVVFAYRMTGSQQSTFVEMAPQWVRDARYDLQARTEKTDVAKDELRLMMRSLLANRFALKVHYEDRSMPVFSMTRPKAAGERFLAISGEPIPFVDYARILREHLGPRGAKVPTRELPDWLVKAFVIFRPGMKEVVPQLGKRRLTNSAKAMRVLGWRPRPVAEALNASADSLFTLGLV